MGSSSHDLGAELRMHSFTVNCDTLSNEEKVAAVVPVTSVEVTCSEAMLALSFSTLLDIDIGTKHRLVAFKRPIIFIYFDSHCRFMDILAAKFQY